MEFAQQTQFMTSSLSVQGATDVINKNMASLRTNGCIQQLLFSALAQYKYAATGTDKFYFETIFWSNQQ